MLIVNPVPDKMVGVNGEDTTTRPPPPKAAVLNCISVPDIILSPKFPRDARPPRIKSIPRV